MSGRDHGFARHLAAAYAVLVVYASLYPFSGWSEAHAPPLAWLTAPWPRYTTAFDVAVNFAAYVPLGLLAVAAAGRRLPPWLAALSVWLGASLLSLGLETVQNFLPGRVPSNVDLGCNALGAAAGCVMGLRHGSAFAGGGAAARWRARRFLPGRTGDLGLVLIALWLLTQLDLRGPLFGNGDLRRALGLTAPIGYGGGIFFAVDLLVAATGAMAAGLVVRLALRGPSAGTVAAAFALALAAKALAWSMLLDPSAWLEWLTPGARLGLLAGAAGLAAALWLPRGAQRVLTAAALLATGALTNLAPENPYSAPTAPGHFLNFSGLTGLASSLWPFLALAWLVTLPGGRTAPDIESSAGRTPRPLREG